MKEQYINDIEIIKEAILNNDLKDALQMLDELKQDFKLAMLIA